MRIRENDSDEWCDVHHQPQPCHGCLTFLLDYWEDDVAWYNNTGEEERHETQP